MSIVRVSYQVVLFGERRKVRLSLWLGSTILTFVPTKIVTTLQYMGSGPRLAVANMCDERHLEQRMGIGGENGGVAHYG